MSKILKKKLFEVDFAGWKTLYVIASDSTQAEEIVAEHIAEIKKKEGLFDEDQSLKKDEEYRIRGMKVIFTPVIY